MNTNLPLIDPVLTTEAARILEVSPETVRHWERVGILHAVKTHKGVRLFDRYYLERFAMERSAQRHAQRPGGPTSQQGQGQQGQQGQGQGHGQGHGQGQGAQNGQGVNRPS